MPPPLIHHPALSAGCSAWAARPREFCAGFRQSPSLGAPSESKGCATHQAARRATPRVSRRRSGYRYRARHLRLLGAHVLGCADELAQLGKDGPFGQPLGGGLGDAKVDDLGCGLVILDLDQDVGGLDVPVDHPLVVGMLHSVADLGKELEALVWCRADWCRSSWVMGTPLTSSMTK